MVFQSIVGPELVLCGAILYGSNFVIATGESERGGGVLLSLVCLALAFSHRKILCCWFLLVPTVDEQLINMHHIFVSRQGGCIRKKTLFLLSHGFSSDVT